MESIRERCSKTLPIGSGTSTARGKKVAQMARMSLFSGNPSSVPVTLAPSDSLLHEQTGMSGAGASTVEYTNEAYLTARNEKIAFKTKK